MEDLNVKKWSVMFCWNMNYVTKFNSNNVGNCWKCIGKMSAYNWNKRYFLPWCIRYEKINLSREGGKQKNVKKCKKGDWKMMENKGKLANF